MKKMKIVDIRTALGALATCALLMVSSQSIANCYVFGASSTGCYDDPGFCNPLAWNFGYSRAASWVCCYDSLGNLTHAGRYTCDDPIANGGCCNVQAPAECPPLECPSTEPI
jgi:hypothetical protein